MPNGTRVLLLKQCSIIVVYSKNETHPCVKFVGKGDVNRRRTLGVVGNRGQTQFPGYPWGKLMGVHASFS